MIKKHFRVITNNPLVKEELSNKEVLNKANEAVLVIKKQNQMLRKLTEKIINVEYIGEIQKKVLENKMLPAY